MKEKKLPQELLVNVFERPDYLDKINIRGDYSRKVMKLAIQIKTIPANQCVKYTWAEFEELFKTKGDVKQNINRLRAYLRNVGGVKSPRVVFDDGKLIIWENRK